MAFRLHRRTFLRGAGGVAIGLPVLECMLDDHGLAHAGGGALPQRFAIVFAGQALGADNYAKNENRVAGMSFTEDGHFIAPAEVGSGYTITTPLQTVADLRDDFSIVSNMRIPWNAADSDPGAVPAGGAYRDFHGGGCSPLISGTRSTAPNFTANGITSDQVIAQMNPGLLYDSLVFRAQPSWYLSGSSYAGRQYISYTGAQQPVEAQVSPQNAFTTLFGSFTPDDGDEVARLDFELRARRSVLDLILAKRDALVGKVGAADRIRLEQHFDELRELEMRVAAIDPGSIPACALPPDPGADPDIGGDNAGMGSGDIGTNTGYSDEDLRARVLVDLIHMAFICDLSRVATLQVTTFQSHMNVWQLSNDLGLPIRADQHEVGHNGDADNRGQIVVSTILGWHVDIWGQLVRKLKETPEGAGTALDNSVVVFMPEAGHGLQLNDGVTPYATHSVEEMVQLTAGRAGGLVPGKHIDTAGAHPVQNLISAMQAVGYDGETLGEVSGNIPELFG
ncbi:DUF1552 domain-containing protein [Paraliomyxa miuraensis]|uniref:DUF1552 domain-containing protein n=1 Tax=Paraliomyxa miuraensis TaxID=376150 RepID=UPI0022505307|nr:DUF1552 domain-containing protein [Paraliomyxa miuraensis]MCX4244510.1 DUF1552 domain-containing protein [Paraliomyxa miuraensis]